MLRAGASPVLLWMPACRRTIWRKSFARRACPRLDLGRAPTNALKRPCSNCVARQCEPVLLWEPACRRTNWRKRFARRACPRLDLGRAPTKAVNAPCGAHPVGDLWSNCVARCCEPVLLWEPACRRTNWRKSFARRACPRLDLGRAPTSRRRFAAFAYLKTSPNREILRMRHRTQGAQATPDTPARWRQCHRCQG